MKNFLPLLLGVGLGIALGAGLGAAFDNIGVPVGVGWRRARYFLWHYFRFAQEPVVDSESYPRGNPLGFKLYQYRSEV